jgi:hypothetical protein
MKNKKMRRKKRKREERRKKGNSTPPYKSWIHPYLYLSKCIVDLSI